MEDVTVELLTVVLLVTLVRQSYARVLVIIQLRLHLCIVALKVVVAKRFYEFFYRSSRYLIAKKFSVNERTKDKIL